MICETGSATTRDLPQALARADHVLSSGRTVVIDGSFRSRAHREAARAVAARHRVPFRFVECQAELDACRHRLEERARNRSLSDGRLAIFDEFIARFEPVTELAGGDHLRVHTTRPIEENLERLRRVLPAWPEGLVG